MLHVFSCFLPGFPIVLQFVIVSFVTGVPIFSSLGFPPFLPGSAMPTKEMRIMLWVTLEASETCSADNLVSTVTCLLAKGRPDKSV